MYLTKRNFDKFSYGSFSVFIWWWYLYRLYIFRFLFEKFWFLNDESKAQVLIKRAKNRIIQFYNSDAYQNFFSNIQSIKTSDLTSNSILNTLQFNVHSTPQNSPSSLESQNTTSFSNRTVLTPISINSNRKRTLKQNYIENLNDKNINFIEEEN